MKLVIITNLYPRPDQPQRGIFNAQLFEALAEELAKRKENFEQEITKETKTETQQPTCRPKPLDVRSFSEGGWRRRNNSTTNPTTQQPNNLATYLSSEALAKEEQRSTAVHNIVLVPEWRMWKWPAIRAWKEPAAPVSCPLPLTTTYLPVFYIPLAGRNLNWWTYELTIRRFGKRLLQECDAVLATWLYPDAVAAVNIARRLKKPIWIKIHGSDTFHLENSRRRKQILKACDYAEGILPNCKYLAEKLVDAGIDEDKVHVIANGVNGDVFRYRAKQATNPTTEQLSNLATNPAQRTVLFVGNLVHVKGPDILLDAWAEVVGAKGKAVRGKGGKIEGTKNEESRTNNQQPNNSATNSTTSNSLVRRSLGEVGTTNQYRLLVIGDGKMRKQLERQAGKLGITDSITFLGSRPHEEIALWMNLADCLCLPSRSEGMPNVVIEALASGLPVVASDVGEVPTLLDNEEVGFVVPGKRVSSFEFQVSASQLADALEKTLDMAVDRKAMAEKYRDRFSWKAAASSVVDAVAD